MEVVLDSDDLFIESTDGFVVRVLKNITFRANDFILTQPVWTSEKNVNPANDDTLKIFERVLFGGKLKELAAELKRTEFTVNRLGYVYANTKSHENCRLNDLFDWRKYGVELRFTNLWNRCSLYNKESIVSLLEPENSLRGQREEVEKELHQYEKLLEDKETEYSCLEKKLGDKENKKQDCWSQLDIEKRLQGKEKELEDCKSQLKEKERKLAVMVGLLEKEKELEDCKSQLKEKERELAVVVDLLEKELKACKSPLKGKERELAVMAPVPTKSVRSKTRVAAPEPC